MAAATIGVALVGLPVATASLIGPPAARAATHVIDAGDGFFSPASLTVAVGDTVTWTNVDDAPHTVTAENASFDSGNMDEGAVFTHTFTEAGTFPYVCVYHPGMSGSITVVAPAPPSAAASAGSGPAGSAPSGAPAASEQPNTALPAPAGVHPLTSVAALVIGLGLVAFAVALAPIGARPSYRSEPRRRAQSGWRR